MKKTPRVAAIHDLTGFGRCSLAVAGPVLSAMGVQCCPMPTAYLSTHPAGFDGYQTWDMTEQLSGTIAHYETLGLRFDGVYTGLLFSLDQAELCIRAAKTLKAPGGVVVADPVMGDHGRRYAVCPQELCPAMAELCRRADVITPNLTEAALLLGRDPAEQPESGEGCLALAGELHRALGCAVVLTGVSAGPGLLGAACCQGDGRRYFAMERQAPGQCHGTGDIFAAVFTGALVRGAPLEAAAGRAAAFAARCVEHTLALGAPPREGVDLEPLLGLLTPEKDC